MEFLKLVRRRSFVSEVVYIGLNVIFAVAVTIVMLTTQSIFLAILLVMVSKWRVLAVRIRYWFANIQANLVDFIVSLSNVFALSSVVSSNLGDTQKLVFATILTVAYIAWLVIIKPRSSRFFVVMQAAIALFFGVGILFSISYAWPVSIVVLAMWLIGFATARHVLSAYDETHLLPLTLVWATILAEIGWIAYHWTVGYRLPFTANLYLPQVAIIALLVGFVAYKAYDSFFHHQKIRTNDVILPILFTVSIIVVFVLFFNNLGAVI